MGWERGAGVAGSGSGNGRGRRQRGAGEGKSLGPSGGPAAAAGAAPGNAGAALGSNFVAGGGACCPTSCWRVGGKRPGHSAVAVGGDGGGGVSRGGRTAGLNTGRAGSLSCGSGGGDGGDSQCTHPAVCGMVHTADWGQVEVWNVTRGAGLGAEGARSLHCRRTPGGQ